MIRRSSVFIAAVAIACLCLQTPAWSPDDYFPGANWRRSKPAAQALDKRALKKLVRRMRENRIPDLHSLLIVRNGFLVLEEYFNGWQPEARHTLQSDSKSVTSLLTGIAVDKGLVTVEDSVVSLFPEYRNIRNDESRKQAMKVKDLLTMRTGLDWSENNYQTSPLRELNESTEDWLKFVLDWPMREQPGSRFEYNSGGVIVLGGAIGNVAGQRVDRFAEEYLFGPIGIEGAWWHHGYPDGLPHTGGGLNLTSRDMARIGYLVLRDGRWGDRQIVSAAWIEESTSHIVRRPRTFGAYPTDYGYLWWLLPIDGVGLDTEPDSTDVIAAIGARGQYIMVIPRYDMVVVVTGGAEGYGEIAPLEALYTSILPSVLDR